MMNATIPLLFARKFRSFFLLPLVPLFQAGLLLQASYKVFLGLKSDLEKPSKYGKMQVLVVTC